MFIVFSGEYYDYGKPLYEGSKCIVDFFDNKSKAIQRAKDEYIKKDWSEVYNIDERIVVWNSLDNEKSQIEKDRLNSEKLKSSNYIQTKLSKMGCVVK
jgi:hypothetical protein